MGDRLLKEIVVRMSRNKVRHFSFADMIRLYLERYRVLAVSARRKIQVVT